ncbi:MAG: hypothetical protein HRU80_09365 [Ignavibacteriales bacterium]|nr:MAG: hypothetical protein HRU80_09365 [Ignavibacteriales bacterium]
MKTKQMFWGIFFLTIGILLLLNNILEQGISLDGVYEYWPILLILAGASIMVKNTTLKIVLSGLNGLILAIMLYSLVSAPFGFFRWDNDTSYDYSSAAEHLMDYDSTIQSVTLNLEAGAGAFAVNSDSEKQYSVDGKGIFKVSTHQTDSALDLIVRQDEIDIQLGDGKEIQNFINIALHNNPEYSFNLALGAATANLNLGNLKLKDFSLKTGATSIDLTLGMPSRTIYDATIEMGMGSVSIRVPKEAGVKLDMELPLSATDLSDFTKVKDNTWQTDNYGTAPQKIHLKISGGFSSLRVSRF